MKIFMNSQDLLAVDVYKHSSSSESFLVLYHEKGLLARADSIYPPGSVFIGAKRLNRGFFAHVLIAPDGKIVIGTSTNGLYQLP